MRSLFIQWWRVHLVGEFASKPGIAVFDGTFPDTSAMPMKLRIASFCREPNLPGHSDFPSPDWVNNTLTPLEKCRIGFQGWGEALFFVDSLVSAAQIEGHGKSGRSSATAPRPGRSARERTLILDFTRDRQGTFSARRRTALKRFWGTVANASTAWAPCSVLLQ